MKSRNLIVKIFKNNKTYKIVMFKCYNGNKNNKNRLLNFYNVCIYFQNSIKVFFSKECNRI